MTKNTTSKINHGVTAEDVGCWIDGAWGWKASGELVCIAMGYGFECENWDDDYEFIHELADEAEAWMNDVVAPEGHSFGWHDGEWFLDSDENWEQTGW